LASKPTIAFDIEVVAPEWEELDEATRGYLLDRAHDEEERRNAKEKLALMLGLGRIVTIGMWRVETGTGAVLVEGERGAGWQPWHGGPEGTKIFTGGEKDLLIEFWATVARCGTLVSYSGRTFDGPVLMVRSSIHAVVPSRQIMGSRYRWDEHCDLMDVLGFQGAVRDRFRLDYWCRRYGLESPKSKLDGSQVGRYYREGRLIEIAEYCLQDTRATAALYNKVYPVMIEPFDAGF